MHILPWYFRNESNGFRKGYFISFEPQEWCHNIKRFGVFVEPKIDMSNSRFAREARPQLPGELVDDGSFQCCVRIGRSCLLCGKKSSYFPYTWFVSAIPILSSHYFLRTKSSLKSFSLGLFLLLNRSDQTGPACVLRTPS